MNKISGDLEHVKDHYAEVAQDTLTFVNACATCDTAPATWTKSESDQLYGEDVLKGFTADLAVLDAKSFKVKAVFLDGKRRI